MTGTMTVAPTVSDSVIQDIVTAARFGDLEDLQLIQQSHLLSTKFLCHARSTFGNNTALHMASANGHLNVVTFLTTDMAGPCDIDMTNDEGSTSLHWAALNGHIDIVKRLLECGASATLKNTAGKSPITVAAQADHIDVMDLLLKSFNPDEDEDDRDDASNLEINAQAVAELAEMGVSVRFEDTEPMSDDNTATASLAER
ncbi:ankyrin repeat-containing protein [Batrachochytrium dendrobatidis]|nr:ankyrin repeat-containing protein [Batrachochytrium dendrobatidis]KAK5666939.1 ankyrin repeat-containing protein [Batrachochytrium dendrobatidis]